MVYERSLTARSPWAERRIVLGVTGGIAAYKAVQLASDLTRLGAIVDTVMTDAARAFVAPLSFEGVTGGKVYTDMFAADGVALHLQLASEADAVVVAPATVDLIARAAHGRADDLLAAVILSTRAPVLLAPAMNERMYSHPQTQRNLNHCSEALGYELIGPTAGAFAASEGEGMGRMCEPFEIAEYIGRSLGTGEQFADRRVLVTAGPTREAIDPVRFIGNRSSGRMGFALARESWLRGASVTLVTGPSSLSDPVGVTTRRVETADQMLAEVTAALPQADLVLFSAAVSDFRPADPRRMKIKRRDASEPIALELEENPDVALETLSLRKEGAVVVGFALETGDLLAGAAEKLRKKNFDMIVGNDPGEAGSGFDVPTNRATLLFAEGKDEVLPLQSKERLAGEILDRVVRLERWAHAG